MEALVGLPPHDLLESLAAALRANGLDIDEVFSRAVTCTGEWLYDPCRQGSLRDRFTQRYQRERTMPIRWRSLQETLDPQPIANVVIRRLLTWMDSCDAASQRGWPRPAFVAEDGPIFPPEGTDEEFWWLTDVGSKAADKKQGGDEDGPADSDEEASDEDDRPKGIDEFLTDSDPDSPRSDQEHSQSQPTVVLPVASERQTRRAPWVAWRR